jgi:hypothetical protein
MDYDQSLPVIDWEKHRYGVLQQAGKMFFIVDDEKIDVSSQDTLIKIRLLGIVQIQGLMIQYGYRLDQLEYRFLHRVSRELKNLTERDSGPMFAVFLYELVTFLEKFRESFAIPPPVEDDRNPE